MMYQFRNFNEADWKRWPWAVRWGNRPPSVSTGEMFVADWPEPRSETFSGKVALIVDAVGISIMGDEGYAEFHFGKPLAPEMALLVASSIPNPISVERLRVLGFSFSNFNKIVERRLNFVTQHA